jgi:hypothetical protein
MNAKSKMQNAKLRSSLQRMITLALCAGLAAVAALVVPTPRPALACTPPPGGLPNISIAERTQASDLVVEGEVTALADADGIPGATATIQVRQYLKGSGPEQLTVTGYGPAALCRSDVQSGDVRVFYIVNDGMGGLRALYLSQFDAAAPATAFLISQVATAAAAPPEPVAQAAQAQPYPYPPPVSPTTPVPTLPPPTFIPPTFAPATPTLPLVAPTLPPAPTLALPTQPPAPPGALPTIGSATASEIGVPVPATSAGFGRSVGPFSFIIGALALAGAIAFVRRRFRSPR